MTISFTVEGEHLPITRVITPFHSLNAAVSGNKGKGYGFPTRSLIEVSGNTGVGKSTLVASLSGYISQSLNDTGIDYLDMERQSDDTIFSSLENSGFAGTFRWVSGKTNKKEDNTAEKMLSTLEDSLWENPAHIGVLDSVAAISSVAEREGEIGDANIGRRAFPMAQFVRRVIFALGKSETPSCMFMLNHQYDKIGTIGPAKQITSPGGEVKNNLSTLRIRTKVPWVDYISGGSGKKEGRWDEAGAWILEGLVDKNRDGKKNSSFQVFIYGGWGIHVGMTAVIDCLASGLAEVKTGAKVFMDGMDFGSINKIVENKKDDRDFFVPFQNALKVETVEETETEEE